MSCDTKWSGILYIGISGKDNKNPDTGLNFSHSGTIPLPVASQ